MEVELLGCVELCIELFVRLLIFIGASRRIELHENFFRR